MGKPLFFAAGLSLAALLAAPASGAGDHAQYPTRPVRVLVPQSPGASNDTVTRIVAAKLSETLGQQFVIDNRPGAGGVIAAELTINASPDGYTLYATATASQVIGPQTVKKVSFNPIRDFAPVALFAVTQNMMVVHPQFPARSVKEVIAHAKANPGKLNFANAGAGTQSHLAGVLFAHAVGIDVAHVPYKGGGPSVASVVAGESHVTITPGPAVAGPVRSGRLRALATGGRKRSPLTPHLPTFIESGVNLESTGWIGMVAPKGTPRAVVEKLHAGLKTALEDPETRKLMESQGADPQLEGPEAFRKLIEEEYRRFGDAIRIANLKAD
jgi:tripartite-type tricarboxylate transporter receptor subunit TctC